MISILIQDYFIFIERINLALTLYSHMGISRACENRPPVKWQDGGAVSKQRPGVERLVGERLGFASWLSGDPGARHASSPASVSSLPNRCIHADCVQW